MYEVLFTIIFSEFMSLVTIFRRQSYDFFFINPYKRKKLTMFLEDIVSFLFYLPYLLGDTP